MSDPNQEQPAFSHIFQPLSTGFLARIWEWFASKPSGPRIFVPVFARDAYQQRPSPPSLPWWSHFSAWLRYHSIQLRWDIERQIARLADRRWH